MCPINIQQYEFIGYKLILYRVDGKCFILPDSDVPQVNKYDPYQFSYIQNFGIPKFGKRPTNARKQTTKRDK